MSSQRIKDRLILRLPSEASLALPSRGQVAVEAVLNGRAESAVVEAISSPPRHLGWTRGDTIRTLLAVILALGLLSVSVWLYGQPNDSAGGSGNTSAR